MEKQLVLGESLLIWRGIGGISQGRGRQDICLGGAGESEQKAKSPRLTTLPLRHTTYPQIAPQGEWRPGAARPDTSQTSRRCVLV